MLILPQKTHHTYGDLDRPLTLKAPKYAEVFSQNGSVFTTSPLRGTDYVFNGLHSAIIK